MKQASLLISMLFLLSCASAIPMTTRISDPVLTTMKTSKSGPIAFEYASLIQDGQIQPCERGLRTPLPGHPGYIQNESQVFGKMLNEYVSMRFPAGPPPNNQVLKATLNDFWIEQFSPDSAGSQTLAILGGGEINIMLTANLQVQYEILKNGQKIATKTIKISGDSSHVAGMGTHTETSNLYRGKDSIEYRLADAINDANNKALIMLNLFLEENQF